MFLTPDEIRELTGYQRHADQRAWLEKRGWKFEISANGRPVVLRSFAAQRMGEDQKKQKNAEPNFSIISKAA